MQRTIVVVGGALSGPTAAARARETDEHARIILITLEDRVSFAAAGAPYLISGEVPSVDALDLQRVEELAAVYRVAVMPRTEVTAIDPVSKHVTIKPGKKRIPYDTLIAALGASMREIHPLLRSASNASPMREPEDLARLSSLLARNPRARVAVIGAGVKGVSMVDALVRRGAEVTLIERSATLLPEFGPQVTRLVHDAMARRARVLTGATLEAVRVVKGCVTAIVLEGGTSIATDYVVVACGMIPRTELLARAGAHIAPDGSVYITERAETSLPDVYACGICVSVPHVVSGAHAWSAQGSVADKTAQVAGANAAGGNARLARSTASVLKRVVDLTIGRAGLSEAQARVHVGADFDMTTIHAPSHDVYFPGSCSVLVQLYWDRATGRVLGCEIAGEVGVDKRVDVAACAMAGGLTIEALATIDFAYAPPFGSQRDPLNVAASVAASERAGLFRGVTPEELAARYAHVTLVDVRRSGESGAALPGAIAIPLEELRARMAAELPRGRTLVAYCSNGRRGYLATRILLQAGFPDARNLEGGLRSWQLVQPPAKSRKEARA